MLNAVLVVCCLILMSFLSHHWYGLTVTLHSETRHKRITRHLDWAPQDTEETKKKRGFFKR